VFVLQWKQILKLGETRQFNALLQSLDPTTK
jgi:hypothetical protein